MTSHLTDELAQCLVDGLLPDRVADECRAHLDGCAECSALVDSYVALGEVLDGLDAPLPPPDFTDAVMTRVAAREEQRAWERRLAIGILAVTACAACLIFALLGASSWAPVVSRASDALGRLATAATIGADVAGPLLRALRLQIALGCAALGLPVVLALWRLVPGRAEVSA